MGVWSGGSAHEDRGFGGVYRFIFFLHSLPLLGVPPCVFPPFPLPPPPTPWPAVYVGKRVCEGRRRKSSRGLRSTELCVCSLRSKKSIKTPHICFFDSRRRWIKLHPIENNILIFDSKQNDTFCSKLAYTRGIYFKFSLSNQRPTPQATHINSYNAASLSPTAFLRRERRPGRRYLHHHPRHHHHHRHGHHTFELHHPHSRVEIHRSQLEPLQREGRK